MATIPDGRDGPIGTGPVATVYSGLSGGVPLSLKVFPSRFDRRTAAAVERELGRLRATGPSPSILVPDGLEQLPDGRHALRMERCGQSLEALAGRVGPLGVADAVVLGHALAVALAAAHGAGVVHGGVKPANVLFRASGQPVVADFGVTLRRAFPRDPAAALECLAPETLRTEVLDERTDLYGLGAVLHIALTGGAPLPGRLGERPDDRVLRVLGTPVPAIHRPDVPVELSTVVGRLLATDPADRPESAAWVADRLAEMIAYRPAVPAAVPPAPAAHPPVPAPPPEPAPPSAHEPAAAARPDPDPAFDDFDGPPVHPGSSPPPEPPLETPAAPQASTEPDVHDGRKRLGRTLALAGAGLAAAVGVVLVLTLGDDHGELTVTPRLPPVGPASPQQVAGPMQLELAPPTDLGDQVVLNWTSARGTLDFAVVVAEEGMQSHVVLANRNHTMTVPVDPIRKYCFQVQATDSTQLYESRPEPVRGAVCHP